jgi:hypothetical protein
MRGASGNAAATRATSGQALPEDGALAISRAIFRILGTFGHE